MDRNRLIEAGVDYDEGVERFAGRAEMFEKYLKKFFEGELMADIERQLNNKDIPGAFRTTHDLKGASGNLSINTLYSATCTLTEQLRDGNPDEEYSAAFAEVKRLYEAAAEAVSE